jgi:hypothetical protein
MDIITSELRAAIADYSYHATADTAAVVAAERVAR